VGLEPFLWNALYDLKFALFAIMDGAYGYVPYWVWGFLGFVLWLSLKILWRSLKPGRKRGWSKSVQVQSKASRKRHTSWKGEAAVVLKQLKKVPLSDEATVKLLQSMSPFGFEYLITEGLRGKGAEVRKIQRVTGDGGIDGMVRISSKWHLIQAKRYTAPVSAGMISEFLELCQNKRMPGFFVATNGFSEPAKRFARKADRLTLLDGGQLVAMLR